MGCGFGRRSAGGRPAGRNLFACEAGPPRGRCHSESGIRARRPLRVAGARGTRPVRVTVLMQVRRRRRRRRRRRPAERETRIRVQTPRPGPVLAAHAQPEMRATVFVCFGRVRIMRPAGRQCWGQNGSPCAQSSAANGGPQDVAVGCCPHVDWLGGWGSGPESFPQPSRAWSPCLSVPHRLILFYALLNFPFP